VLQVGEELAQFGGAACFVTALFQKPQQVLDEIRRVSMVRGDCIR
jgi:hypothetical protein